jgi:hypothetical protein
MMTARVNLLFSPHHLSLTLLTLTPSVITLLFLNRFNRMATDMDSLAAELDGHVVRLGIGCKGLRKTRGNPLYFFRCTPTPLWNLVVEVLIKVCQFFAHTLPLLSLILLLSLAVFVQLHLLGFYSSLVIPITTRRP